MNRNRKRSHGEGGLRERAPGVWEIKFFLGRHPGTGHRQFRYMTVKGTKKEALDELAKLRHQRSENALLEPQKLTVGAYLESWLAEHAVHRVSPKTFERYAEIVRLHLIPPLGSLPLSKLAPSNIQASQSHALTAKRRRVLRDGRTKELPALSALTVKHIHRTLSQALKQAVRLRLIARNPAEDVDPPRAARRDMNILSHEQSAALIKIAEPTGLYLPVAIALTTGMRRGEILALRWREIDLDARTLSVTQTLEETKAALAFKAPKTERSRRTITLPPLTVTILRRHRAAQAAVRLKAGPAYTDRDLVCCSPVGEPLHPHLVSRAFADLAKRQGFRVRFHDLRHTHISHLLAAGVHPKVASERAGHASISITLDVYSHLIPGMQEDAANRIDAALRAHLEP
jgi:integrase